MHVHCEHGDSDYSFVDWNLNNYTRRYHIRICLSQKQEEHHAPQGKIPSSESQRKMLLPLEATSDHESMTQLAVAPEGKFHYTISKPRKEKHILHGESTAFLAVLFPVHPILRAMES
jgi:hypothetical protein